MRRGILSACRCRIIEVHRPACKKKPLTVRPGWAALRRRAQGQTIRSVGRVGKRLLIHLESDTIVIEPRMSGLVLTEEPPTREHLRLELRLQGGDCDQIRFWDQRGLGTISLFSNRELQDYLQSGKIGPDALDISPEQLKQNLSHRNIAIKVGLLNQGAVAGVGNIYASELLHRAKVHPEKSCKEISPSKWNSIHQFMLEVLHEAIKSEGSTLSDGTYRTSLNQAGDFQNRFRVYDRENETCIRCKKGRIRRIVQAQRSTYYCPSCQRSSKSANR